MISHLALIMDGNRRWAKKNSLLPWFGHKQGVKNVEMAIQYCLEHNISNLSLYTFSLENFKRTPKEISFIFSLLVQATEKIEEFLNLDVRIRFVGDCSKLPVDTKKACDTIEERTKNCKRLTCNFLLCYGGQQEIVAATQKLVNQKKEEVTLDDVRKATWLGVIPDPDVIIRTGGIKRLSNFLLFQAGYAEIRFLDCFWPDLTKDILNQTVQDCIAAQKNIGK